MSDGGTYISLTPVNVITIALAALLGYGVLVLATIGAGRLRGAMGGGGGT